MPDPNSQIFQDLTRGLESQLAQNPEFMNQLIHSLSNLPTESVNPLTETLASLAQEDLPEALKMIVHVETRSIKSFIENHLDKTIQNFLDLSKNSSTNFSINPRKIFLVGAGASGRMALFIKKALLDFAPEHPLSQKIQAVIAGGDAALVHAVPGFEDDPEMAKLQLEKQSFNPGDILIGFSASGRTPFVLEALKQAKSQGGSVLLISTNPEASFSPPDHTPHLSLYTEPPAIVGSTRLSPTSHMMMACGVFIAQAALNLEDPIEIKNYLSQEIETLGELLKSFSWANLAKILALETNHLEKNGRLVCEIEALPCAEQIIFHDLTERTPTAGFFPLRPLKAWEAFSHQTAFAYPLFTQAKDPKNLWSRLLGSQEPFCLNLKSAPETLENALLDFDFSQKGGEAWSEFLKTQGHDLACLNINLSTSGLSLSFKTHEKNIQLNFDRILTLSPYFQAIFLKIILNTYSTGLMAKLGLIHKNRMNYLMPTNYKLVARSLLQIEERLLEKKLSIPRKIILEVFLAQLKQANPGETSHTSMIENALKTLLLLDLSVI